MTDPARWSRSMHAPLFSWAGAASVAVGLVLLFLDARSGWTIGVGAGSVAAFIAAAACLVFGWLRVSVDHRGLRIRSLTTGIPLRRVPLAQVADAHAEHLDPWTWGGWGYRRTPGRTALVLRAGPGLVVTRTDGHRFATTLDDADTAADLLNGLASRP